MRFVALWIFFFGVGVIAHGQECSDLFSDRPLRHVMSRYEEKMNTGDSIFIKLFFRNNAKAYKQALKGLKSHGAHFISQGHMGYKYSKRYIARMILKTPSFGQGMIALRVRKEQIPELLPYIEMANDIVPTRYINETLDGISESTKESSRKFFANDLSDWSAALLRNAIIKLRAFSVYDEPTFRDIFQNISSHKNIKATLTNYNKNQSIGFILLEGKARDLREILDQTPEIDFIKIDRF